MDFLSTLSFNEISEWYNQYRTYLIGSVVIVLALGGIGVYWYYNTIEYERAAQQALSELLTESNRAYESTELWQDIEIGSRTAQRQYKRSSLVPFFNALYAESLLQQDKVAEALIVMDDMFKKLTVQSPLYYPYRIKYARVKLDSNKEQEKEEGLVLLKALADDDKNILKAEAQYYLAQYYLFNNEHEKAQEILRQLTTGKDAESPWVRLAQQELK